MRNGAMSEVDFACFNAVREFDDHRIVSELEGVDVSNMMSRKEYVRFLNKTYEDIMYPLPKILEERVMMMNKNKEQGFKDIITANNKRKRDKKTKKKKKNKKKKNEVDYDVSAADLYPNEGSKTELDLTDPVIRADIDDKIRRADELIKQFEKEEEEKQKMKKEKKKNKKTKKKKKKNEVDYDVSAADHYPGDGSTYTFTKLDLSDPVVRAEMDDKITQVELLIKQYEKEDVEKMKEEEEEKMKKKKNKKKRSSSSNREE